MPLSVFLILIVMYGLSAAVLGRYLKTLSRETARIGRSLAALAICIHLGALAAQFAASGTFIPANTSESQLFIAAFLGILAFTLSFRSASYFVAMVLFMMTILCLGFSYWASPNPAEAQANYMESPPSPWLWVHILLAVGGEICLLLAAAASIVFLIVEGRIRSRHFSLAFFSRIPSLPDFDRILGEILLIGFGFLTLGMALGFFVANSFWQSAWWWDPKVVLCFLTWLVYALLLILRAVSPWYRGRTSAWLAMVGFLAVLFLSFGMDQFIPTRHPGSSSERLLNNSENPQ